MTGVTGWSVDGNDLRTLGFNVHDSSSWDSAAGVRGGQGIDVAYADGAVVNTASFTSHIFNVEMLCWGRDPATGNVITSEWEHVAENVDTVKGYFASPGELDLRRTMPDSSVRQALGNVAGPIRSRVDGQGALRYLSIPFHVSEGSWRDITGGTGGESDATNTNLTGSGNFNITTDGNVRTSPRITIDADTTTSGLSLTFPDGSVLALTDDIPATQTVVIDTGYTQAPGRTITLEGANADAMLSSVGRRAYWAYLEPGGVNTISYASTAGQFDVTVDWYDRWR